MDNTEDKFEKLIKALTDDITGCAELLAAQDSSQVVRRAFVRAVLASIEGNIYWMKQEALEAHNRQVQFSVEELALLKEETYNLSNNGKAAVRKAKLRLRDNLNFAFKMQAKSAYSDYSLNLNSTEWNQFLKAITVRDRLMHPKRSSDLIVTDEELEHVQVASLWFLKSIQELRQSLLNAMSESTTLLEKAIDFSNKWLKLINGGRTEESWECFASTIRKTKSLEEWKFEREQTLRKLGHAVFRKLIFKTRLLDESEPTFMLKIIALYKLGKEIKMWQEDLSIVYKDNSDWRIRSYEIVG